MSDLLGVSGRKFGWLPYRRTGTTFAHFRQAVVPPPSSAARPGIGPQGETPKVPNEKITKLDRANDHI